MNQNYKLNITYLIAIFIILILFFNTLGLMTAEPFRGYGRITDHWTLYISFFILMTLVYINKDVWNKYNFLYLCISLFVLLYVLSHFINNNFAHNQDLLLFILTLCFMLAIIHLKWNQKLITGIGFVTFIMNCLYIYHWSINGQPMIKYSGLFTNTNLAGVYFFTLLCFQIYAVNRKSIVLKIVFIAGILMSLLLAYVTSSRTVLLAILTIIASWVLFKLSRKLFPYLIYIVLLFNLVFLYGYGLLANSEQANYLNELSREYFNKNFFSGRETIWNKAIEYGLESPFFGHGVGVSPQDFLPESHYVHVHNQYLQIFLESGFIGLALFIFLIIVIWRYLLKNIHLQIVQWSAFIFLGLLVYQNTEISLFFNMPSIGLLHWFLISIGVSTSIKNS
ncbi:hypothetical protein CEY16_07575 [Halalkalibacillus sediminis]|uniref:O-antigen ligase-related domain-containing protein n=1 Tax=Halalkalibacillus sediminis TaxID=2018042 RepID=A0A2I0QTV2_9BACI|nr:O-antigen ligase family protein [Halalkalibacillus sediminis]PKR77782.1 hypothetical protein CEY16_07575 [Halalkalibacillus sediminis]